MAEMEADKLFTNLKNMAKGLGEKDLLSKVTDLEKLMKDSAKALGDSNKSLDDVTKALEGEVKSFKGTAKDIRRSANAKSLADRDFSKITSSLETVRKYLIAIRGGLTNVFMQMSEGHPTMMAAVNIVTAITDIFDKLDRTGVEANTVMIQAYASSGALTKLDLSTMSSQLASIREKLNAYGVGNEEADQVVQSYASSSGAADKLSKSFDTYEEKGKAKGIAISDLIATYSKEFGLDANEFATYVGDLQHSFKYSGKQSLSTLASLYKAQKDSGMNSKIFLDAVKEATDKNYMYGDQTVSNSNLLSYLSRVAGSSGAALELFQKAQSVPEDFKAVALSRVFSSDDPELQSVAKRIKSYVDDKATNSEDVGVKSFFSIIQKSMSEKDGKVTISGEGLTQLRKEGVLGSAYNQLLKASYLYGRKSDKEIYAVSTGLEDSFNDLLYMASDATKKGLDKYGEEIIGALKTPEGDSKDSAYNKAKDQFLKLMANTKSRKDKIMSTADQLSNKLSNIFLSNFGDKGTEYAMTLKSLLDGFTNSAFLRDLFSPNVDGGVVARLSKEILDKANVPGWVSKIVSEALGGMKHTGDLLVSEKSFYEKAKEANNMLYDTIAATADKHGIGKPFEVLDWAREKIFGKDKFEALDKNTEDLILQLKAEKDSVLKAWDEVSKGNDFDTLLYHKRKLKDLLSSFGSRSNPAIDKLKETLKVIEEKTSKMIVEKSSKVTPKMYM